MAATDAPASPAAHTTSRISCCAGVSLPSGPVISASPQEDDRCRQKDCSMTTVVVKALTGSTAASYHPWTPTSIGEAAVKLKLTTISGPHQGKEFVFEGHDTF